MQVSADCLHWSIPQPICLPGLFTGPHSRRDEPSRQESSLNRSSLPSSSLSSSPSSSSSSLQASAKLMRRFDQLAPPPSSSSVLSSVVFLPHQLWLVHIVEQWLVNPDLHSHSTQTPIIFYRADTGWCVHIRSGFDPSWHWYDNIIIPSASATLSWPSFSFEGSNRKLSPSLVQI